MRITVVHALPQQQSVVVMEVEPGTTLRQAVERSGLWTPAAPPRVGVFGHPRALQETVGEGDRVEIYRELLKDPKTARRQRAQKPR